MVAIFSQEPFNPEETSNNIKRPILIALTVGGVGLLTILGLSKLLSDEEEE
jgi:hypothetical protein